MSGSRRGGPDDWWRDNGGWEPKPRRAVAGGVGIATPGRAASAEGLALVEGANRLCTAAVASRARTYARRGQVVGVDFGEKSAVAQVQGSGDEPYFLSLYRRDFGDYTADCDCPYGCGETYWCKHAVALAYVVANLIDRDLAMLLRWTGDSDATVAEAAAEVRISLERLAKVRIARPSLDLEQVLAAAADIAPPP